MRAKCIRNTAAELGEPRVGIHYGDDHVFDVVVSRVYDVFAMSLFQDGLHVLVRQESGWPHWLPMGLFEVADPRIPDHWEFVLFPDARLTAFGRPGLQAVWGYHEITIPSHLRDLNELNPEALAVLDRERNLYEGTTQD
jgi:hypothetical protein